MILLVSGATKYPRDEKVGHLVVPGQGNKPSSLDLQPGRWAMDNGAFGGSFDTGQYVTMLERYSGFDGCLFVTAPDVIYKSGVGDAAATLDRWPFWSRLIRGIGFSPAFVAQDGLRCFDVPWDELGCLFIGGSTRFKLSSQVHDLVCAAIYRQVWVHWGRINSEKRLGLITTTMQGYERWSIDGTGFSMAPDTNIPKVEQWQERIQQQPELGL